MSPRLAQLDRRVRGCSPIRVEAAAHFPKALHDPGRELLAIRASAAPARPWRTAAAPAANQRRPGLSFATAVETFERLGARSWAWRAEAELFKRLRHRPPDVLGGPDALADLTPQQREIVRLAGSGLTNREIADRMFLSPRTVSSHLYRSYPKLGVAGRHQLHTVIAPVAGMVRGERQGSSPRARASRGQAPARRTRTSCGQSRVPADATVSPIWQIVSLR